MEPVIEDISRWESEGGKALPEQDLEENEFFEGEICTGLVKLPRKNELLVGMDQITLRKATSHRDYVTNWPRRDYVGLELISVAPSSSLSHVLRVLARNKISCVPTIEPDAVDVSRPGVFRGFVDMLDVATFFAECTQRHPDMSEKEILATPIGTLIDRSHKDPAHPCHHDLAITSVLDLFSKGLHRVPLFDDNKHISGLCSQYDVVSCMADLFEKGSAVGMGTRSVQQYKEIFSGGHWGECAVVGVPPNISLREALVKMADSGLSALAVVENGRLVGQLSVQDLTLMIPGGAIQMASWLDKSVQTFLDQHTDRISKPVFELADVTMAGVCKTMCDYHAHHVWIVDSLESMRAVGVVTMTDVCRVAEHFKWPSWLKGLTRDIECL